MPTFTNELLLSVAYNCTLVDVFVFKEPTQRLSPPAPLPFRYIRPPFKVPVPSSLVKAPNCVTAPTEVLPPWN
ncbi:MAG TPA: hypothetical protein VIM58_06095, partial [Candidatus Methylacidiphilales bacterium]